MKIKDLFMILPDKTMDDKIKILVENSIKLLSTTWQEALAMNDKYELIFYVAKDEIILVRRIESERID